jgi:multidrug transporter EmrE-like cation transporter
MEVKNVPVLGSLFLLLTIVLTVYGQLVLKWRMNLKGAPPEGLREASLFLIRALFDPYVFSTYVAAFLASLAWMAALTKFELSLAYPFMSISFILVLIFGGVLLGESMTPGKIFGVCLIAAGIFFSTR